MGKFINTDYKETVQSVSEFGKSLLNNQYYRFNDKKGIVIATYYNINKDATSLDPGSLLAYDELGKDSPIRLNRIEDFVLYNFPKIELDMDNGDFGLESQPIRGECVILPNTITPCEGDFFEVPIIYGGPYLWKVTKVGRDTLENGQNAFKIEFILDRVTNEDLKYNIADEFICVDVHDGTNHKAVVESKRYQKALRLEQTSTTLKDYFIDLFFNRYVQTFTVQPSINYRIYDPFLIEFLIRNEILIGAEDDYVSVEHQMNVPVTFSIDYNKSIFRAIENGSKDDLYCSKNKWHPDIIDQLSSIFDTRFEEYYSTHYMDNTDPYLLKSGTIIGYVLSDNLLDHIDTNTLYDLEETDSYQNILIQYFNDVNPMEICYDVLDRIDYGEGIKIFYLIPILIFCIEKSIKKLLN